MKEGLAIQKRAGSDMPTRLMPDLTGSFYTLVLEITAPNMAALEASMPKVMGDKEWQATIKLSALVDSGSREIFTIVE
jgi:hypothetical protein